MIVQTPAVLITTDAVNPLNPAPEALQTDAVAELYEIFVPVLSEVAVIETLPGFPSDTFDGQVMLAGDDTVRTEFAANAVPPSSETLQIAASAI